MLDISRDTSLWFGWLKFRPKCLQFLNTPKWFLFFVCQYFLSQSIVVNGAYSVSITTIEKRFGYSSVMTGVLTSTYDIAVLLLTPFVSFLGARRRKPLWCGVGLFIMGVGFFVFAVPHFIAGRYIEGIQDNPLYQTSNLCGDKNTTGSHSDAHCKESKSHWGYFCLFVLGMFIIGVGGSPMWNLGTSYMDENVKAKAAPMYIGIFSSSGVIGAGIGFVLGGIFLSMYVDIGVQTSLTPKDEGWVGAWWLGFLMCSGLCVVWSVWLVAFPKEFPKTQELRLKNMKDNPIVADVGYAKLKDLPKATKLLLTRVPYVAVTLGTCVEGFLMSSLTAFMPKIIQQQFRFTPSTVSLVMGGVVVPAALLGNIIGSYICKRLQLGLQGAAKMCYIVSAINFLSICLLFFHCDTIPIAGVNTPYMNGTADHLSAWCNSQCACSLVEYSPVCSNGVTYFSPCHAGCVTSSYNGSFSSCSCLLGEGKALGTVISGSCPADCGLKPVLYLSLYFLAVFLTFFSTTPATVVTLRCVPTDQRAYALGIQSCALRILGTIPGPVVMGSIIDATCILWHEGCGADGNCLEYNNKGLKYLVFVMAVVGKLITTVCYVIARVFIPREEQKGDHNNLEMKSTFLDDNTETANEGRDTKL